MATATIIKAWKSHGMAHIAVRINDGGTPGDLSVRGPTEYSASVPLEQVQGKTAAEARAILRDAVKSERDRQLAEFSPPVADPILGLTGTLDI